MIMVWIEGVFTTLETVFANGAVKTYHTTISGCHSVWRRYKAHADFPPSGKVPLCIITEVLF